MRRAEGHGAGYRRRWSERGRRRSWRGPLYGTLGVDGGDGYAQDRVALLVDWADGDVDAHQGEGVTDRTIPGIPASWQTTPESSFLQQMLQMMIPKSLSGFRECRKRLPRARDGWAGAEQSALTMGHWEYEDNGTMTTN